VAEELDMKSLAVALKKATDDVKAHAELTTTEVKNLGKITDETKSAADKALSEMGTLSTRIVELEQKAARRGTEQDGGEWKSVGQQFIDSPEFKAAAAAGGSWRGRATLEVKAVTALSTSATSLGQSIGSSLIPAQRVAPIALPQTPVTIRSLLAPGNTTSNAIEYARQTGFQNLAAPVAELALKPQSDMTWNMVNTPVRTVAHWMKASKQIMADAPGLRSMIDGQLLYGLSLVEDQQLLLGDGTSQNLNGLMTQATAFAAPTGATTATTAVDRLRLALLQATLALLPPSGIVLNNVDWSNIELQKDTTGRYIYGDPQGGGIVRRLWGLPVAPSFAMAQNNFLVGAFSTAAQIFDREDANVMVSTEDQDNFVKNAVTILAEERLALAVYRPAAFIKGNFTFP
jgi:HK97 family phage major capsid protein